MIAATGTLTRVLSYLKCILYILREHMNYATTESACNESIGSRYVRYNSFPRYRHILKHLLSEERSERGCGGAVRIRPLYSVFDRELYWIQHRQRQNSMGSDPW